LGGGYLYKQLNKDIREINKVFLSLFSTGIILVAIFVGINITESSYALFSDKITSNNTIELTVSNEWNYKYIGKEQTFIVPKSAYYYIELGGAEGGGEYGGKGAITSGYIYLEKGETLYIYVGEKGNVGTDAPEAYNGGGKGSSTNGLTVTSTGGGATDIRLTRGTWDDISSLISRIMVAGAGAGGFIGVYNTTSISYYISLGGSGGTLYGANGNERLEGNDTYGKGGRQISGGAAGYITPNSGWEGSTDGTFGEGGTGTTRYGGGGGSGYYGGGGAGVSLGNIASGAGGSSYISGYAGVNSVEENTTITHTNQTLHYSGKYFIGGKMLEGQNEGNGYATIKYIGEKPEKKTTKLDNVRYIKNCISYNTYHNYNHWIEVQAIKDGVNIAKGKSVTGTNQENSTFPYNRITDGDITHTNNAASSNSSEANQCITVDLGNAYDLDEVAVWNYFGDPRSYYDNITSVSSDNNNWVALIDEAVIETSNGHRVNAYIDTYNGYIQDDLVLWYDGYANTGSIRSMNATIWRDLSGNNNDGEVSGATWNYEYLSFDGEDDYVNTIDSITYNSSKAFTLQFVGVVEETEGGNLFESSTNDNQNDGSYYVTTNDYGIKDLLLSVHYPSVSLLNTKMSNNILGTNTALYTIIFDTTREHNNYLLIYKNDKLQKIEEVDLRSGADSNGDLSNKTLNDYILYIASRAGTNYFTEMNLNSLRIYTKALTEDEVINNYNYDKEKFNLN